MKSMEEKIINILEHARKIIYEKSEEKDRQYGDFFENMEDAAKIASVMSKKEITAEDVYHSMIGLKFARESNSHKYDNLMDGIAYIASLHEYKEHKLNQEKHIDEIIVKEPVEVNCNQSDKRCDECCPESCFCKPSLTIKRYGYKYTQNTSRDE
jgi:hypothetical protein